MKKKRHGITNNPKRREKELKKTLSNVEDFKVEKKFSNQRTAQKWENTKSDQHPGGKKTKGPIYGYSHSYSKRKPQK